MSNYLNSEVNEARSLVQMYRASINKDWVKVYVTQIKNRIMINVGGSVKN